MLRYWSLVATMPNVSLVPVRGQALRAGSNRTSHQNPDAQRAGSNLTSHSVVVLLSPQAKCVCTCARERAYLGRSSRGNGVKLHRLSRGDGGKLHRPMSSRGNGGKQHSAEQNFNQFNKRKETSFWGLGGIEKEGPVPRVGRRTTGRIFCSATQQKKALQQNEMNDSLIGQQCCWAVGCATTATALVLPIVFLHSVFGRAGGCSHASSSVAASNHCL